MSLSFFTFCRYRVWAVTAWLKLLNFGWARECLLELKSELFIDFTDLTDYLEFLEVRLDYESALNADCKVPKSKERVLL